MAVMVGRFVNVDELEREFDNVEKFIPAWLNAHCPVNGKRREWERLLKQALKWGHDAVDGCDIHTGITTPDTH